MSRTAAVILSLLVATLASAPRAEAILGASVRVGGSFIPDGRIPGGIVNADIGPLNPFAEIYRKSGVTTVNLGGHILLKLPLPLVKPYGGIGGGITRSSGGGASRSRTLFSLKAGADLKIWGNAGLFGQIEYLYTFGSGSFGLVRKVAIQAGLAFGL